MSALTSPAGERGPAGRRGRSGPPHGAATCAVGLFPAAAACGSLAGARRRRAAATRTWRAHRLASRGGGGGGHSGASARGGRAALARRLSRRVAGQCCAIFGGWAARVAPGDGLRGGRRVRSRSERAGEPHLHLLTCRTRAALRSHPVASPPSLQDGRPLWQFCDPGGTELVTPPLLVVPRGQPPAADSPVLLQRLLVAGARHLSVLNANAGAGGAKATLLAAAPTPRAPPLSIDALIALTRWCGWLRSIIRCSRERRGRRRRR